MASEYLVNLERQLVGLGIDNKTVDDLLAPYFEKSAEVDAAGVAAARKVFDLPELLELILLQLSVHDIFRVQAVSRQFRDAIDASGKIQRQCGFQADDESKLRIPLTGNDERPFHGLGTFYVSLSTPCGPDASDPETMVVTAHTHLAIKMPRAGSKTRSILICQPPIKHMEVFMDCCTVRAQQVVAPNVWTTDRVPTTSLDSDTGITVGDIMDTATRLHAEHRLCPDATVHYHDDNGFVVANIRLEAKVKIDASHPMAMIRRNQVDARIQRDALNTRLRPYIAAKRTGMFFCFLL